MPRVLTFSTDAHQVYLTLPDGTRLMEAAPHGVATFALTADQAQTGRYVAETKGVQQDHRTIEVAGFSLSDALRHGLNVQSSVPNGMSVGFSSPLSNYDSTDQPIEIYVNGSQLTASIYEDGQHLSYIEKFGAGLLIAAAPAGPWDGSVSFVLSVRNVRLQALPGFTFAVDITLKKAQVPNFAGIPGNGYASAFGEKPSWNSTNLQNTPISGNFHGTWPLFPNFVGDTGARPISIPTQTNFAAQITVSDASTDGVTLQFSEALNPNEFGVGLDAVGSWATQWAADNTSVRLTYGTPVASGTAVTVIVFRAVDPAGNMIGGPVRLTAE
jgi:hypothetical protein